MSAATCLWWFKEWPFVLFLILAFAPLVKDLYTYTREYGWRNGAFGVVLVTVMIFAAIAIATILSSVAQDHSEVHYIAMAERICGCKW